jgi:transcriptional regulator MraZ
VAFRGHFEYALDAKNRLNVPAKIRAAFSGGVVLAQGPEPCVWIWVPEQFERWTQSFLADLNPLSLERRKLTRYFAGTSFDAELDSAGRVTLNPSLIEYAGIDREVTIVGNLDHLEVWDRRRWAEERTSLNQEISGIAESLGHPS